MSWPCKLVADTGDGPYPAEIGSMWFCRPDHIHAQSDGKVRAEGYTLSDEYLRDWKDKRPPIFVRLPKAGPFCVDSAETGKTTGWTVTGEAPNITVSPSINCVGLYHGWLTAGVVSDG